ncbi:DNA replication factor A subunit Ssb1 [Schizosaccharomyces octosporus yFS286]|uniref:Replication protein A subunit n=1 Tax=Schizosaccharomyces octosporus (strain yFS286) TaxID=483514 RepID=S9Q1D3_SCHOY|nr:DNA replication factor A subunit Ssb1 [Schizosaccharomyces octosporus yFS286]EPX75071.1 DNA replication factor A subunit Ssb1 [Schizosaccharomyces octosporus yFS286]
MAERLSVGSLRVINTSDSSSYPPNPVLQVLTVKELNSNPTSGAPKRYRVVLSDSINYAQSMLSTQLNHLVAENKLAKGAFVQLTQFTVNIMKERKILIVLGLDVLTELGFMEKIGNPAGLETVDALRQQPQTSVNEGSINQSSAPANYPANTGSFYGNNSPSTAPAPPPMVKRPSGPNPTNGYSTIIYPIEGLSPYQNKWTIRARVTNKSDIKHWHNQRGEGKLFSVNLLDESGEIRATGFNDQVDAFYDILHEGQVYYISRCRVNIAKKQFTNVQNEYELMFERDTEIKKAEDQSAVPVARFSFVSLQEVGNVAKDAVIDVIGVLQSIGPVQQITSRATSRGFDKRDITVVDQTGFEMRITLWGKLAIEFSAPEESVLAFKGVKVNDFQGRSLSMLTSSTMSTDPDIQESHLLKGWYDGQGRGQDFAKHSNNASISSVSGRSAERKTIADVQAEHLGMSETPDYFSLKGTIVYIRKKNVSYPACPAPDCNRKVFDQGGSWRCEKCNKEYDAPQYRYIMTIAVGDHTGQLWLNVFDDVGKIIMHKSADELNDYQENDENAFMNCMAEACYMPYIFQCRAKQDNFKGETRVRYTVTSLSQMNWQEESKKLIDYIQAAN